MSGGASVGEAFAEAFVAKEPVRITELLHPEIDFHGLTPNRTWKATGPEQVVADVLRVWFADFDDGAELAEVASHSFAGRESVTYRFTGRDSEGPFVCEQHAYLTEKDGRINWIRLVCSGFCAAD